MKIKIGQCKVKGAQIYNVLEIMKVKAIIFHPENYPVSSCKPR